MSMKSHYNLIIVGCGAAGMMAAISASKYCSDILIIERNNVVGKKIAATGNGKCNFTNLNIEKSDFRSDSDLAYSIYHQFNNLDVIEFFKSIGVPVFIKNGYCYPHSQQACSVRDALLYRLNDLKIEIELNTRVRRVEKNGNLFSLTCEGKNFTCNNLLMAAGGEAQHCFGTDGSMYYLAGKLGHSIIKPRPALVGLTTDLVYLKELIGVRLDAKIDIYDTASGKSIYTETGEIIFSKNGISGIPVMNSSRFVAEYNDTVLRLDLFPETTKDELVKMMENAYMSCGLSLSQSFTGMLNCKMLDILFKSLIIPAEYALRNEIAHQYISNIAEAVKCFIIPITGNQGFDNAQTTAGGIPLTEINEKTMESKVCPGLYFAGELIDVDGKCGGYNLQWAWTTGAISGAYAGGGYFDKSKLLKT